MIYKTINNLPVAQRGTVIIEGVKHYVSSGWVVCDNTLNHKAWNVTEWQSDCPYCKRFFSKSKQLKLF